MEICKYSELTQKYPDNSITCLEATKIMSCGITVSPCGIGFPSPGTKLDSSDSDCTAAHPTLVFHWQSFSIGSHFLTHQRRFLLSISCGRKKLRNLKTTLITVVYSCPFNNPHSCHGNCGADEKCKMFPGVLNDKIND